MWWEGKRERESKYLWSKGGWENTGRRVGK
jgi:hypothetical protein